MSIRKGQGDPKRFDLGPYGAWRTCRHGGYVVPYVALLDPTVQDPDGLAKITGKCGDTMHTLGKSKNGKICKLAEETFQGTLNNYMVKMSKEERWSKGKEPKYCIDT